MLSVFLLLTITAAQGHMDLGPDNNDDDLLKALRKITVGKREVAPDMGHMDLGPLADSIIAKAVWKKPVVKREAAPDSDEGPDSDEFRDWVRKMKDSDLEFEDKQEIQSEAQSIMDTLNNDQKELFQKLLQFYVARSVADALEGAVSSGAEVQGELKPLSFVGQATCLNETTLEFSYRDNKESHIVNCPDERPFCNEKLMTCVTYKPNTEFSCPFSDGFYPVIDDCTKFIICQNNISYTFQCPPKHSYSQNDESCGRWTKCRKIDCNKLEGKWVAYPKDKRLHSLCYKNVPVSLNQCPVGWVFSPKEQQCIIDCVGDGLIHDPQDNTRYYSCQMGKNGFEGKVFSCPHGLVFDQGAAKCVPKADSPDKPSSTPAARSGNRKADNDRPVSK